MKLLALSFVFALTAAACGGSDDDAADDADDAAAEADDAAADADDEATDDEATDGDDMADEGMSGEINVSGSSTVEPISIAVAENFNAMYPDVNISVAGPGTGDGFQLFCEGETDVSDASRQIKDEEAANCADAGIEYVEIKVAVDGIAVMTNPANEAVECLAFGDLYGLVGPESTGFGSWADANTIATEAGGNGDMPDAELVISAPGAESGTFDSFIEIVLEDIADERGQDAITRPDYNPSADDNVILQGIQSVDTSFGWVGFAFAENASDVKLIEVDGGDGCVAATAETIASNEYPVSRPLFIYVNNAKAAESEALSAFVDFYLETGLDQATAEVGYVELGDDAKAEIRANWG